MHGLVSGAAAGTAATATATGSRLRLGASPNFMATLPPELNNLIVMFAGLPCHATVNKTMHAVIKRMQLWLTSHYFFALHLSRREWRDIDRVLPRSDVDAFMFVHRLRKFRLTRCHYLVPEDVDLPLAPGDGDTDAIDVFLEQHTLTLLQNTTMCNRMHEFLMRNFLGTFHECLAKTVVLGNHYLLVLDHQNRWLACNRVPPMHRVNADVSLAQVPADANDVYFHASHHITDVLESLLHFLGWGPIDAVGADPMFITTYHDRSTTVRSVRVVC